MLQLSHDEFERLVVDALDLIPDPLMELLDNVVFLVEDRGDPPDTLGLYDGIPITERDQYGGLVMPDRIFIYRLALLDMCRDHRELVDEIAITVVHEVAHYFGIDDDRLHDLGWD